MVRGAVVRDRGGRDCVHHQPLPADVAERAASTTAGERAVLRDSTAPGLVHARGGRGGGGGAATGSPLRRDPHPRG